MPLVKWHVLTIVSMVRTRGTDDLRIIRCLLENGADPTFEKLNETPLDVVCSSREEWIRATVGDH